MNARKRWWRRLFAQPRVVTTNDPFRIRLLAALAGVRIVDSGEGRQVSGDRRPAVGQPTRDAIVDVIARRAHCRLRVITDETGISEEEVWNVLTELIDAGEVVYDGRAELTDDAMRARLDVVLQSMGVDPAGLRKVSTYNWRAAPDGQRFDVEIQYTRRMRERRYMVLRAGVVDEARDIQAGQVGPFIYPSLEAAVRSAFRRSVPPSPWGFGR